MVISQQPAILRNCMLVLLTVVPTLAATPPPVVNYQGVLRNSADQPLDGPHDMVFRFMDAATGGNEILVDQHTAATGNAVGVSGGLFGVQLGAGTIADGAGPGTYTSLDAVFRDHGGVWVEVGVGAETLTPRTRIQSAAYALNAGTLDGQPAGSFLDTSSTAQAKTGRLDVTNAVGDEYAIVANGTGPFGDGIQGVGVSVGVKGTSGSTGRGGEFKGGTYGPTAEAVDGTGSYHFGGFFGVRAQGGSAFFGGAAGLFQGQGIGMGIKVLAEQTAGRFETTTNPYSPSADLATSNIGVRGNCLVYGCIGVHGNAESVGVSGQATGNFGAGATGGEFSAGGNLSVGVEGSGVTGGRFLTTSTPGLSVEIAGPAIGVKASGGAYAGFFQTGAAGSIGVYAQGSHTGVNGDGGSYGGSFTGAGASGVGVYGSSSGTGVRGHGGSGGGGYFENASSGNGRIGYGDTGLVASGNFQGGEFRQGAGSGAYARLAYGRTGIAAYASNAGENPAYFQDLSSSSWASVGQAGFKIMGSGAVSFVQNDPESSGDVIVYAAPEGDEVAVYTRGSARLVNGEARVPLGPTFRKVANPDLGLTAQVTPVGDAIPLAVAEKSTSELVVRGPSDSNVRFDYVVWGLRIGFEDRAVVQPKERESFIPSRDADNAIYLRRPELRMYSARQRFLAEMAQRESTAAAPTMDKSLALEQAIGVYDRARDESRIAPRDPGGGAVVEQGPEVFSPPTRAHATAEPPSCIAAPGIGAPAPALQLGVAIARVEEEVQAGDVVVADPAGGDGLRLGAKVADPLLAGIVVAPAPSTHLEAGEALVALAGSIVPCRVDSTFGAIHAGDLLTSSPAPGYAMRATDAAPGTILGKALQDFDGGAGTIRVFVMAR